MSCLVLTVKRTIVLQTPSLIPWPASCVAKVWCLFLLLLGFQTTSHVIYLFLVLGVPAISIALGWLGDAGFVARRPNMRGWFSFLSWIPNPFSEYALD